MKITAFIIFLFTSIISAQVDSSATVTGMISDENGVYLILDDGYLLIDDYDPYEEYYREIYNDSTIVNPNTELKSPMDFQIIPFLMLNPDRSRLEFEHPYKLGVFIQETNSGLIITEQAKHFLHKFKNLTN